MDQAKSYAYVIERAEDGSYWAHLPDLPGGATTADSPECEKRDNAKNDAKNGTGPILYWTRPVFCLLARPPADNPPTMNPA